MRHKSFFVALILIAILFSLFSCMKRQPIRIYDASRTAPAEAARIRVPEGIEVVSIDDQRVKSLADYVLSTIEEIHVAPGEHEIIVRYSSLWPHDKKKREAVSSENIALMFNAERGGLYELSYPELNDMMEAKRFAENPEIRIAKVGTSLDWETEIRRAAAYKAETEKPFAMKEDSALKEEWYSMSRKEKEEFRKWMEWNRMSDEEREKFQEWINKGKE